MRSTTRRLTAGGKLPALGGRGVEECLHAFLREAVQPPVERAGRRSHLRGPLRYGDVEEHQRSDLLVALLFRPLEERQQQFPLVGRFDALVASSRSSRSPSCASLPRRGRRTCHARGLAASPGYPSRGTTERSLGPSGPSQRRDSHASHGVCEQACPGPRSTRSPGPGSRGLVPCRGPGGSRSPTPHARRGR